MMSLTKMRPRQRLYFKAEVELATQGPSYWAAHPELEGRWLGRGSAGLGLGGSVVGEVGFDRLFGSGAHPATGRSMGRGWSPDSDTAVAGYSLTFSPPKSVSVLWACGDDRVATEMLEAQGEAVRAGLAYLEDHAAFTRRGRGGVLQTDTDGLIAAAFEAWFLARAEGHSVIVMASDHETVDALALRARAARVAAGEVSPDAIAAGRHAVGVGDEVLSLRNDRRLRSSTGAWLRNGQRWRIDDFGPDGSALLSSLEGHGVLRVPGTYVSEHLALGYATTIHKGQGLTVDEGIVAVEAPMSAEALYVGMTRGRAANRALVICEGQDEARGRLVSTAPVEVLGRVMRRVGAEASAHRVMRAGLSRYDDVVLVLQLVEEHSLHVDREAGPDRTKEIEALVPRADLANAWTRLATAEQRPPGLSGTGSWPRPPPSGPRSWPWPGASNSGAWTGWGPSPSKLAGAKPWPSDWPKPNSSAASGGARSCHGRANWNPS